MKVSTKDLEDVALSYCVAKAQGHDQYWDAWGGFISWAAAQHYDPAHNWEDAGPIIFDECIDIRWTGVEWVAGKNSYVSTLREDPQLAWISMEHEQTGETPILAAMRSYVLEKLGSAVEIPDALLYPTE